MPKNIIDRKVLWRVCSGRGNSDTRKYTGRDYDPLTWAEIVAMAETPQEVERTSSRWLIPSTFLGSQARTHAVQREHGVFWMLAIDVDKGNYSLDRVLEAIWAALGGQHEAVAYSTNSAKADDRRWRVFLPLSQPIEGWAFTETVRRVIAAIEAAGVKPDDAMRRPGQYSFLPNRGEFYEARVIEGDRLDPTPWVPTVEERAEMERMIGPKRESREGDEGGTIGDFNDLHSIEELLVKYRYVYKGDRSDDWRSPMQESASFATRNWGEHWTSMSESDAKAGIGREAASGCRFGDAFDLFVHFEHGGDWDKALKAARRETTNARMAKLQEALQKPAGLKMAQETAEAEAEIEDIEARMLARLVLWAPSNTGRSQKFMCIDVPSTLVEETSRMLPSAEVDQQIAFEGAAARVIAGGQRTGEGPIRDPRKPYGFVPNEEGDLWGVVNVYRHRPVTEAARRIAREQPDHWALEVWRDLTAQVFPKLEERRWAEQWVAFKARRPWERMVALVNTTSTTGTGRGLWTNVLRYLFGPDNVAPLKATDFTADSKFNEYMASPLAIMDELSAEAAMTTRTNNKALGRAIYETLKDAVAPGEKWVTVNSKYGKKRALQSFTSFILCTNHEDALPIDADDRRFTICSGNTAKIAPELVARAVALAEDRDALDIIWAHLSEVVSLEGFNPGEHLPTSARENMIDANVSELDFQIDAALEGLGWPLYIAGPVLRQIAEKLTEEGKARNAQRDPTLDAALKSWLGTHTISMPSGEMGSMRLSVGDVVYRVRVVRKSLEKLDRSAAKEALKAEAVKVRAAMERVSVDIAKASSNLVAFRRGLREV